MADDKSPSAKSGAGKRPYATLDLKATEIAVTPVVSRAGAAAASATAKSDPASASAAEVPRPAPASSYVGAFAAASEPKSESKMEAERPKADPKTERVKNTSAPTGAAPAGPSARAPDASVVVARRGGFLSHLAAGVVGGAIALGAAQWGLPQLGVENDATSGLADETASLRQRVTALERTSAKNAAAGTPDLASLENRVTALEKTAETIPALTDSQSRLVADTKAALAAAASDAGAPQLIERLSKVEDKLKALADAGANDPNAGRVEQLAALTGKITDLQSSLSTGIDALRASVTKDLDTRIAAVAATSETARAGTERIDKDVAVIKNDSASLSASVNAVKSASDHVAADLKTTADQTAQLKTDLQNLAASSLKAADITAAVGPIDAHVAALDKNVQDIVAADRARKESSERVVLALELQNLRRALDSGQSFANELAEVRKIPGSSALDLSALVRLQDTGVPSLADLTRDFHAAADNAIDADTEPQAAGVVDRLWAGAKSIVRVRRIDLKSDDKSAEAVVGRMQVALNDGRLADVLDAAKDLSPKAQDAARPFLDRVAARVSVDNAVAGIESKLKSSLASGSEAAAKPQP